ncbi:iduronate-2-sulfatase [Haloferula helveola]|uniref:Iduronate-2-sulfatase n=1 Tax=Haloferula helveola TaxID=490095 RepID=A0ABN6H6F1_9BACT|nr:iduronate-2-sulfatase [Haloferula helveola]
MKISAKLLPICLAGFFLIGARSAGAEERMNVLLLIADDLNTWILEKPERYSGKVIAPNLKKLSESGLVFTHAYTASPFCVPSRTSMFSGVSPHKSGVYHNQSNVAASAPLKTAQSLFETFSGAGYSMYGYGKITHGWRGKDVWDDKQGHKRDPRPPGAPVQSVGKGEQDWGPIHLAEDEMNDTGGANRAIAILKQEHEGPFFLAYGTFNPHMAWFVPQKYFEMFPMDEVRTPKLNPDDFDDIPPLGDEVVGGKRGFTQAVLDAGLHKSAVQAYLATTAYVDVQHGRVLDALAKSPYRDNTIVIFISDHGFHLAEKDHWQKGTLWEEATNSMLMCRVPGMTKPGRVTERCVSLQDLYPTLLDLCGIPRPAHVDGKSLVPVLKNPDVDWRSTAISYLYDQYASIRTEQFRYIRYKDGQQELYDHRKDPHEWKNEVGNPEYAEALEMLNSELPAVGDMAKQLVRGRRQ